MKKMITESQSTRSTGSHDLIAEIGRIRRGGSPEPTAPPSNRHRHPSLDNSVYKGKYSFDSALQPKLDALVSAEVLSRVEFLAALR